jgi:hypothetical protein
MITLDQYFGIYANHPDASAGMWAAAETLLDKVNALLDEAEAEGITLETNPHTGCQVAGETNGGFRPMDCPIGAPASSHKHARAVDVYDPRNELDAWVTDTILTSYGLYREAPESTLHWLHLTDKAPGSGKRTFNP